jgi:hypothetical protein
MLSRQSRSPANTASAPVAAMSVTILSEISGNLTQLPATSAPLFVRGLEITAVRKPRMDKEQTIDIPQFRVWESGDNRVAKADRQRSEASAGLLVEQAGISVHPLFASRSAQLRSIRRTYFAASGYHRTRSSFNPRGERGRRGPRPRSCGWFEGIRATAARRSAELCRSCRREPRRHDVLRPAVLAGIACPRC